MTEAARGRLIISPIFLSTKQGFFLTSSEPPGVATARPISIPTMGLLSVDRKGKVIYNKHIVIVDKGNLSVKILQKYIYWLICTTILVLILLCGMYLETDPQLRFCVTNNAGTEEISLYIAENGNSYVFLPSYTDLEHVTVVMPSNQQVFLDGVRLTNGMSCGEFALETAYQLEMNGRYETTLWFYKSANVATMYIDTATGSMEYIHKDKGYEENASITLFTADGKINFRGEDNTIKGRGNATWDYDKRPYSLMLSSAADLLDMGSATNWVLLANATDETNLNNYLVFDLASRVGLPWVPECRYVDIYLNGEYSGLYLLTEKVEVGSERLNLDSSSGDFLCKFDLESRWTTLRNPFLTNAGRTVELTYPEVVQQANESRILSQVNQMEQIILSGTDLNEEKMIDLDSWVRRYLIDEIAGNIDSDLASSYFYFLDDVCYAGPIWDYDMSFGNATRNQEPNAFIAKNAIKAEIFVSPYYSVLYENKSFYNRMVEIYRSEFLPVLQQMLDGEIQNQATYISKATQMNSIRWRSLLDTLRYWNLVEILQHWDLETAASASDLINYLDSRVAFLNHAWLENVDYCTIQFEFSPGGMYWNIAVPRGNCLETSYVDIKSIVWIDSVTQNVIDFNQPIWTDMIVKPLTQQPADTSTSKYSPTIGDYVTFLSIAIMLLLLVWFIIIDTIHRRKERRGIYEQCRTKISP